MHRDLYQCLESLDGMSSRWPSARQCRVALKMLLDRLAQGIQYRQSQSDGSKNVGFSRSGTQVVESSGLNPVAALSDEPNNKRRRYNDEPSINFSTQPLSATELSSLSFGAGLSDMRDWQPVLEYTGPDFGFDAAQVANGDWQTSIDPSMPMESTGTLFSNPSFDAYVQYFGNNLNFQ